MRLRLVIFVVLLVLCVAAVTQNLETFSQAAPLHFFGLESKPIKLYALVLGAFLAGLLIASVWTLVESLGLRSTLRRRERELERLERELAAARKPPLDEHGPAPPREEKMPER